MVTQTGKGSGNQEFGIEVILGNVASLDTATLDAPGARFCVRSQELLNSSNNNSNIRVFNAGAADAAGLSSDIELSETLR